MSLSTDFALRQNKKINDKKYPTKLDNIKQKLLT